MARSASSEHPIRRLIDDATRGGDRGAEAYDLGAEIVRLARLATSIHLVESVRRMSFEAAEAVEPAALVEDRPGTMREVTR